MFGYRHFIIARLRKSLPNLSKIDGKEFNDLDIEIAEKFIIENSIEKSYYSEIGDRIASKELEKEPENPKTKPSFLESKAHQTMRADGKPLIKLKPTENKNSK